MHWNSGCIHSIV